MSNQTSKTAAEKTVWPNRAYLAELMRPWKLSSFALGMGWLLYGAATYNIPDWDVGISVLMGGLTYVCSPWSVGTILVAVRDRSPGWVLHVFSALLVAWFVVDGVYVIYHTAMGNEIFRVENFYASSALYFLAGTFWLYRGSVREFIADVRTAIRPKAGKR